MYHNIWTKSGSIVLAILPLPFSSVFKSFFQFIALPILYVPIRYLPMMTMRNVIIETINSFPKPFIKFSALLIKQDDNHEQQNQCHHHPFFLRQIFPWNQPTENQERVWQRLLSKAGQEAAAFLKNLKKEDEENKRTLEESIRANKEYKRTDEEHKRINKEL